MSNKMFQGVWWMAVFFGVCAVAVRHFETPAVAKEIEGESIFGPVDTVEHHALLDDEPQQPRVVYASMAPTDNARPRSTWHRADGQPNYFRIVMLETKRREAMGHPGRELVRYKDGREWAVGYGNHIKYLSAEWQRVIKKQGWKVTEGQARKLLYNTFESLDKEIKRELPNLTESQLWAVKSLAFNWGWGNVRRSGLYGHLKAGRTGPKVTAAWMRCHSRTENHRISRRMEVALWHGQTPKIVEAGKNAYSSIARRGDFKHY